MASTIAAPLQLKFEFFFLGGAGLSMMSTIDPRVPAKTRGKMQFFSNETE